MIGGSLPKEKTKQQGKICNIRRSIIANTEKYAAPKKEIHKLNAKDNAK